ncbi:hypothetical protein ABIS04_13235 [Shewanella sp. H8]|uniref:hypothetical protein n=1 Tax=Shewanella sp. H8 TaxID=3342676 RepID=UPI00331634CE
MLIESWKTGRDKRYAKKDKVEAFAIQFYTQKNYANPHQAAQAMVDHTMEYAKASITLLLHHIRQSEQSTLG